MGSLYLFDRNFGSRALVVRILGGFVFFALVYWGIGFIVIMKQTHFDASASLGRLYDPR
jgi:hypothetical protein